MNILEEIAERTRKRIAQEKMQIPLEMLKERINLQNNRKASFLKALKQEGMSYICEVKRASPSKGLIAPDFPYLEIAKEYETAGAAAISCLTEPYWFLGSDQYLEEISQEVRIPVLRKDFTVDEYMIYQARALGMDALVEAHDEKEVERALNAGAKIVGVNNRDLRTFQVDMANSIRLRNLAPADVVFVSESGIRTSDDIDRLYRNRVDAVLIGETLMRSADKKAALEKLNGGPVR